MGLLWADLQPLDYLYQCSEVVITSNKRIDSESAANMHDRPEFAELLACQVTRKRRRL